MKRLIAVLLIYIALNSVFSITNYAAPSPTEVNSTGLFINLDTPAPTGIVSTIEAPAYDLVFSQDGYMIHEYELVAEVNFSEAAAQMPIIALEPAEYAPLLFYKQIWVSDFTGFNSNLRNGMIMHETPGCIYLNLISNKYSVKVDIPILDMATIKKYNSKKK